MDAISTIFRLTAEEQIDFHHQNIQQQTRERVDVDCWNEISNFLSFNDTRSALNVEKLFRSDAHSFLKTRIIQTIFEDALLFGCNFLSIADIGNCVIAFKDNPRLGLKLTQKCDSLRRRPRVRRRPPEACACCFPREY